MTALVEAMSADTLRDLLDAYFVEVLNSVPDGEDDLYTLLSNIGTTLKSLTYGSEDDSASVFAEELYKFRMWFLFDSRVICRDMINDADREISLFEALTNYRAQSVSEEEYSFDFEEALDYTLEEYIVSLGSIVEDGYGDGDDYDEDEDYRDPDDDI
jgi:hypothetical protein